jgi:hypothetical protein
MIRLLHRVLLVQGHDRRPLPKVPSNKDLYLVNRLERRCSWAVKAFADKATSAVWMHAISLGGRVVRKSLVQSRRSDRRRHSGLRMEHSRYPMS